MTEKKPTDILEEEHRVIEKVVKAMSILIKKLEMGKDVNIEGLQNIAEFMRVFGDKCHHGKEEKELFPLLGEKGVPMQGCPISALTYEHEMGRKLVKGLAEATVSYEKKSKSAKESLLKQLQGLANLYPNHIWKEDYLLFPMTNKILNDKDQEELGIKFKKVEEEIGPDTHHKYERLAEEIDKKFNQV
ncbi:MAG: hemerythrin domain-containing protein [Candidatus Omnitrophica bacterium]|nr:hemerythrin domain-containing protein [Candidatus Omnitrophota bacterium]